MPVCEHFSGREEYLDLLERAWASGDEKAAPPKRNLFILDAWGGVGKTALVSRFIARLAAKKWHGVKRYFDWSFPGQGASERKTANADEFFDVALRWFGEPNPDKLIGPMKGERLAELVAEHRTLLVLDGLEVLQEPSGRLRDDAMQALILNLASLNSGLCVITTRVAVGAVANFEGNSCVIHPLRNLGVEAGIRLLRELGVTKSEDSELRRACRTFRGHALALTLLGGYSAAVNNGEIDWTKLVPDSDSSVQHLMAPYEAWLDGRPESDVLHVLGLFNEPADGDAIAALRNSPAIAGLTDNVCDSAAPTAWDLAVDRLRRLHMVDSRDDANPKMLDCHPLVREHFRVHIKAAHPKAWTEGHQRLYEHFKGVPAKHLPETLAEMQPLFRAVAHGCYAGLHPQAIKDVYWDRIMRGENHYSTQTLGAYGADQEALSFFFESPWTKPASGLKDRWPADVLIWAGEHLRAEGRLLEAEEPIRLSLQVAIDQMKSDEKQWVDASARAEILCDLLLTIGKLEAAVDCGRQSKELAGSRKDCWQWGESRTTLAEALREYDRLPEAKQLFMEVEKSRKAGKPKDARPFSVGAFRYCYLLLAEGSYAKARKLARKAISVAQKEDFLLGRALANLVLGRADLVEAQRKTRKTGSPEEIQRLYQTAAQYLETAVQKLQEAATQHELPRGFLARATLFRMRGRFDEAWKDLVKAKEIAERGQMKLHLANVHLEAARLFQEVEEAARQSTQGDAVDLFFRTLPDTERGDGERDRAALAAQDAARHENAAESLIQATNYKRAQRELDALRKTRARDKGRAHAAARGRIA